MNLAKYRKAIAALTGAATPAAGVIAALESLSVAYPSWLPALVAAIAGFIATVAVKPNDPGTVMVDQPDAETGDRGASSIWPEADEDEYEIAYEELDRWETDGGKHRA